MFFGIIENNIQNLKKEEYNYHLCFTRIGLGQKLLTGAKTKPFDLEPETMELVKNIYIVNANKKEGCHHGGQLAHLYLNVLKTKVTYPILS